MLHRTCDRTPKVLCRAPDMSLSLADVSHRISDVLHTTDDPSKEKSQRFPPCENKNKKSTDTHKT